MSVVANVAINVDATKAVQQLKNVDAAANNIQGGLGSAAKGASGLGSALTAALGPIITITAAVELFRKSIEATFARNQAETRLKALSAAYGETAHVAAMASSASEKFGLTQTEASKAIGDVYGRLRPLGFGLKEVNGVYEGFNILSKKAALSSDEAGSVFTQLAQSLGSGALRGDEFNRMAESMPAILGVVAKELGVSQTQLRGMAAEGKLSSEVVVRALQSVAKAGGDLDQFLDPSTKAMNSLKKSSEDLFVQFGKLFGPAVVGATNVAAKVFKKMAEGYEYFGGVILPKIQAILKPLITELGKLFAGFDPSILIKLWQGGMIIVLGEVVKVLKLIVPIITSVVGAFRALGENPVFQSIGKAIQASTGFLMDAYNKIVAYKDAQREVVKEKMKEVEASSGMPAKIDAEKAALDAKLATLNQISKSLLKQEMAIKAQIASLDRGAKITSARYEAEKALSDLSLQQLNRQYELATTAEKRLELAKLIFNEQINAAKIEYKQALEAITLGERKIELESKLAELKYKQIQAEGELQILQAKDIAAANEKRAQLQKALLAQNEVIKATRETGLAEQEVNQYKKITAETQYKSKVLTAQIAYEQKLVSKEIGLSQEQAQNLSDKLGSSVTNAKNLVSSTQQINSAANSAANGYINLERSAVNAANAINNAANAQIKLNSVPRVNTSSGGGGSGTTTTTNPNVVQDGIKNIINTPGNYGSSSLGSEGATGAFNSSLNMEADYRKDKDYLGLAKGGVVNGPTLAMVGEGGEREYIIPESKMAAASANYMSGARGGAVIPAFANGGVVGPSRASQGRNSTATIKPQISIQTGPVVQMGGNNYVTMQDLGRAVQTGVRQTLNIIQGDMNMRNQMGLT